MKYQLRFLLVYIVVIASILSFYTSIKNEQERHLYLAKNELYGVEYLKNIYQLSINTAIYHGLLSLHEQEHTLTQEKEKFLSSIDKVLFLQKKYPQFRNDIFKKKLMLLKQDRADDKVYSDFLEYINHENYRIGDISKLLFEEERKIHFLGSMITHYMPEYLISVLISHNIANIFNYKGYIDEKKKSLYIEQSKLVYLSSQELNSIIKLIAPYPDTKKLSSLMNRILEELKILKQERENFIQWKRYSSDIQTYLQTSNKILSLSYELNDEHIKILETNLKERISTLEQSILKEKFLFIFLAILLSIILFYFYKTFTSNIKKDAEIKKINNTLDKMVIFSKADIQGNITYVSSALEKLSGYTREELLGTTNQLCKRGSKIFKEIQQSIINNEIWVGELQNRRKDTTEYWVKATISPEHDENNSIVGFHVYMENITNQKQLEQEKLKTQDALTFKSKFLSNMSHEIRTPLSGIINLIYVMLKSDLAHEQKELLFKMKSASNMLLALINDILDLSKIESGKMSIEKVPFNLEMSIRNITDLLSIEAQQKGIKLHAIYKEISHFDFLGDSLRISQVLTNLLNNAVKFTSEGEVRLEVYTNEKGLIQFNIIDTGIGIKEDALNELFNDFTQADMSTSRKYGGSGLGLSISKNLVELMGGRIWVESEYAKGSKFSFELPLEQLKNEQKDLNDICFMNETEDEADIKSYVNSLNNIKILVAEDTLMNQTVLSLLLDESKLELDFANDGEIAVNKFQNNHYDLVLMDIQMPNMNGYEATKIIRSINENIPIIALSANIIQEDVVQAMKEGMNNFLPKPIEVDKLYLILYKYLKKT